jgi:phosphoserine phosphatase RsbU/P
MKRPSGNDSQVSLQVAPYDKDSNNAVTIHSSANSAKPSAYLQQELAIASEVQKASFPQRPPAIPGVNFATFYKPALSLGGDYYDFLAFRDGAWGIAIGDVSGKGIGAALVLANLQASLRAQTLHRRPELETLMSNVNRLVWESSPGHFFASLFYAEYRPQTHVLKYVNAGHNPPLVLRRSEDRTVLVRLKPECAPVGLIEGSTFTSTTFQLENADVLVAYTDGITESENSCGNAFGHQRLESMLRSCVSRDPQRILHLILDEVSAHAAGAPQADDMTIVVMGVEAPHESTGKTLTGIYPLGT